MAGHITLAASGTPPLPPGRRAPRNARRFRTHMQMGLTESSTLEGEIEVDVIYSVSPGCAPSHDDPGSPPEVTVHALRTAPGADVIDLTWMGTTWIEEDEEMVEASLADDAAEMRAEDARNGD